MGHGGGSRSRLGLMRRISWQGWALALALAAGTQSVPAGALVWPNVVVEVEEDLQSDDVAERRAAASRLAALPASSARQLIPKALLDADAAVRVSAARAAISVDLEAAGDVVQSWLGDKEPEVRRVAAEVLFAFPRRNESLTRLARALGDPEGDVRLAVARALGVSDSPDAVSALLAHIDDGDPAVAIAIIEALERLGDPRSIAPLVGRIDDSRSAIRRSVVKALGSLGTDAAVSALILALRDSDARVRLAVVAALGRAKDPAAVDALATRLQDDPDIDVQVSVLHALAEIQSPRAVALLVDQLSSRRTELSSEALGLMLDFSPSAAQEMIDCLASRQREQAQAEGCARSLGAMGSPESYSKIMAAWQTRTIGARAALAAFGQLGDSRALPVVLEQLSSSDGLVRLAAVQAAGRLLDASEPDGRAVEPIIVALRGARQRPEETNALITLLGKTRAPRAAETLAAAAASGPLRTRVAALRGLGLVGMQDEAHERVALTALTAEHGVVRFEAAVAIRRSGSERALPRLFELLESTAIVDREAVATAISGPVSRSKSRDWAEQLRQAIERSELPLGVVLLEALALSPHLSANDHLHALAREQPSLRPKLAEVWALRTQSVPQTTEAATQALVELLGDPLAVTRANAIWALGLNGGGTGPLLKFVDDAEVALAANAIAAVAHAGGASRDALLLPLCTALSDTRNYVKVNALVALRQHALRCENGRERVLLERDDSPLVREQAANLLVSVPAETEQRRRRDQQALERVAHTDASTRVAGATRGPAKPPATAASPNVVAAFIVPAGKTRPVPGAPFALNTGNDLLRLGWADERGVVAFTSDRPARVRLEVAPGLSSD